ncbi:2564_t:CDS:1 [Gigaspora margarita]|uniref:2564_t:CDS:1 n=1 Tax=Gigaspora margarita TaxID=4874 RepID=A0ABN7UIQ3_GIGMA|nr:2564_t:CDS:1 [Gigaspora margarita]
MFANIFSYKAEETRVFDTSRDNIRVKVEGLNKNVARVILVDENESPIDTIEKAKFTNKATENKIISVEVKGQKSYLITWINSYELRVDNYKIFKFKAQREHVQMEKILWIVL